MFRRLLGRGAARAALAPLCAGTVAASAFGAGDNRRRWAAAATVRQPAREPRRVLIDTDPGVDDAWALLLALGSPDELHVEGVTIVFGNGSDVRTLGANARLVLRIAGAGHVPVSLGGSPPHQDGTKGATMCIEGKAPVLVHGDDNLGNVSERYGRRADDFEAFHKLDAPDFIHETCKRRPGEVSLVCIGPLTNLATALERHPDLPSLVDEVVIMGGAFGTQRGNRTPAAEANFFDDPLAAQAVLRAGFRKVVVAGLDVTHQADMIPLREACVASRSPVSSFLWDVSETYIRVYTEYYGEKIAPPHDAVPMMYFVRPELFEAKPVTVDVETRGELTRGMSIADWKGQWGRRPNCQVLTSIVDQEGFKNTFVNAIAKLPLMPPAPLG